MHLHSVKYNDAPAHWSCSVRVSVSGRAYEDAGHVLIMLVRRGVRSEHPSSSCCSAEKCENGSTDPKGTFHSDLIHLCCCLRDVT